MHPKCQQNAANTVCKYLLFVFLNILRLQAASQVCYSQRFFFPFFFRLFIFSLIITVDLDWWRVQGLTL